MPEGSELENGHSHANNAHCPTNFIGRAFFYLDAARNTLNQELSESYEEAAANSLPTGYSIISGEIWGISDNGHVYNVSRISSEP